jgi:hypothetical protein
VEAGVPSQGSQRGVESITEIGLSPRPSVLPCQQHSTVAPYSLMYHLRDGQWTRHLPLILIQSHSVVYRNSFQVVKDDIFSFLE